MTQPEETVTVFPDYQNTRWALWFPDDSEVAAMLGTHIIPTNWPLRMDGEQVRQKILSVNPWMTVQVVDAQPQGVQG